MSKIQIDTFHSIVKVTYRNNALQKQNAGLLRYCSSIYWSVKLFSCDSKFLFLWANTLSDIFYWNFFQKCYFLAIELFFIEYFSMATSTHNLHCHKQMHQTILSAFKSTNWPDNAVHRWQADRMMSMPAFHFCNVGFIWSLAISWLI